MNRAALIDQIQQARETLEKLLTSLQSAPVERHRFVSHLYRARKEYRRACETAVESGKQIERCVISTFQIAESLGFKGEQHSQAYTLPDRDEYYNSLLAKVGARPAGNTIEKANRDERYASLLASMQNR